jgi:hypothetical protein
MAFCRSMKAPVYPPSRHIQRESSITLSTSMSRSAVSRTIVTTRRVLSLRSRPGEQFELDVVGVAKHNH